MVREAKPAGIPTLIFDSGLDDTRDIVSFVATDNYHGGQIAGRHLGKLLGGKGRVIVLRYAVGSQSSEQREAGLSRRAGKGVSRDRNPLVQRVCRRHGRQGAGQGPATAAHLRRRVDGVFTPSQHVSTGMLRALEEQGLAGKVKFIGFDAGPELVAALRAGKMHGIVLQDPVRHGRAGRDHAWPTHLRGKKVEPRIATGETLATPENMDEPEIKKLLEPELYDD